MAATVSKSSAQIAVSGQRFFLARKISGCQPDNHRRGRTVIAARA
jgi:hypothetical protein